ncbi:MAG TPA: rhodanese-like domain-containing protein [Acidobacteriota bacterium]|nr:rhodanese-like domain-containing protein [Acidobacteriota bacterium]
MNRGLNFGKTCFTLCGIAVLLIMPICAKSEAQVQVDPQTGRAVGAREMNPEDLKRLFDKSGKVLIIDVRDTESFEKETIKGAIHIPFEQLGIKLKEIPKDTTLVFT